MSIFELHRAALEDYKDFVHSFILIADKRAREFVDQALREEEHLWPEPLVQLSPAYKRDATVEELAARGTLHPETAEIFRTPEGDTYRLYKHQVEAIEKACAGESLVVTSGTGSGKTFCYFIPIVDTVVRHPGIRGPIAFIIYPMNALVNSQLAALNELKEHYERRTGRTFPVIFAKYTGETSEEERERIRREPPHILLTNYVMAELLLVRPEDQNRPTGGANRSDGRVAYSLDPVGGPVDGLVPVDVSVKPVLPQQVDRRVVLPAGPGGDRHPPLPSPV